MPEPRQMSPGFAYSTGRTRFAFEASPDWSSLISQFETDSLPFVSTRRASSPSARRARNFMSTATSLIERTTLPSASNRIA